MIDQYKELGFKQPDFLENHYGIRIYIGTVGEIDWCVEIPKELVNLKCGSNIWKVNVIEYCISESRALSIAAEYTELARQKISEVME